MFLIFVNGGRIHEIHKFKYTVMYLYLFYQQKFIFVKH